jgi:hypothetical protein
MEPLLEFNAFHFTKDSFCDCKSSYGIILEARESSVYLIQLISLPKL